MTLQMQSGSSEATEAIGRKIGQNIRGGEIIELISDLGGGKTTITRGIAAGMGSKDKVSSPTFTITKEYEAGKLRIAHYDFYRLSDPGILTHELAEVMHDPKVVIIIEWADIVQNILPNKKITISITTKGETDRIITITATKQQQYILKGLREE